MTNPLPIDAYRNAIMGTPAPYVIVEAETGSGKSTAVPRWFAEQGLRVLVTEPLIETAIGTAEYVAQLEGCELGTRVGYRTGRSACDSSDTAILYSTDGLALVRELAGTGSFDVLIIDELHQWNLHQSTLEAWAWHHIQKGDSPFGQVIVLSATLDSDALSRARNDAPVIRVPGRTFPISDRTAANTMDEDIRTLVAEGSDILVFLPGKAEISEMSNALTGLDAEIIPFHGGLDRGDKNRAYQKYDRPKVILSTNALETGRTIVPSPGRNLAVIDSGLERRVELVDGVEGLYLRPISRAQSQQRRGRTGRVGPGVYVDHCLDDDRPDHPIPEILRSRLDQIVLRLAVHGYDCAELPFFHDIPRKDIVDAQDALRALGAITDSGVTAIGKKMARLPVSVPLARMIVEAEKHNAAVLAAVITFAAILEEGSLRDRSGKWRSLTAETDSDILAELDLWRAAERIHPRDHRDAGIFSPNWRRAKERRHKLAQRLRVKPLGSFDREKVVRCIVAGLVDHIYTRYGNEYMNGDNIYRRIDRDSVVTGGDIIVARPKDIETRRGTLRLLTAVTCISEELLPDIAPQLVETVTVRTALSENGVVCATTQKRFRGIVLSEETIPDENHPSAPAMIAHRLAAHIDVYWRGAEETLARNVEIARRADRYAERSGTKSRVEEIYTRRLADAGVQRIPENWEGIDLALPEDIVDPEIEKHFGDTVALNGITYPIDWDKKTITLPEKPDWDSLPAEGWVLHPISGMHLKAAWGDYSASHWTSLRENIVADVLRNAEFPTIEMDGDRIPLRKVDRPEGVFWGTLTGWPLQTKWYADRKEAEFYRRNAQKDYEIQRVKDDYQARYDCLVKSTRDYRLAKETGQAIRDALDRSACTPDWLAKTNDLPGRIETDIATWKGLDWAPLREDDQDILDTVFNSEVDRFRAFQLKLEKLDQTDLDEHELCSCGKNRIRSEIFRVSGDSAFFCGAEPKRQLGLYIYLNAGRSPIKPQKEKASLGKKADTGEVSQKEKVSSGKKADTGEVLDAAALLAAKFNRRK